MSQWVPDKRRLWSDLGPIKRKWVCCRHIFQPLSTFFNIHKYHVLIHRWCTRIYTINITLHRNTNSKQLHTNISVVQGFPGQPKDHVTWDHDSTSDKWRVGIRGTWLLRTPLGQTSIFHHLCTYMQRTLTYYTEIVTVIVICPRFSRSSRRSRQWLRKPP